VKVPRILAPEHLTPVRMLAAAVASLGLALGTVLYGHIAASPVGPWLSIVFSAAAVACTVASLMLHARP
jgi:predicted membrane channel-forming protein YqfA (hemolysin III family)